MFESTFGIRLKKMGGIIEKKLLNFDNFDESAYVSVMMHFLRLKHQSVFD